MFLDSKFCFFSPIGPIDLTELYHWFCLERPSSSPNRGWGSLFFKLSFLTLKVESPMSMYKRYCTEYGQAKIDLFSLIKSSCCIKLEQTYSLTTLGIHIADSLFVWLAHRVLFALWGWGGEGKNDILFVMSLIWPGNHRMLLSLFYTSIFPLSTKYGTLGFNPMSFHYVHRAELDRHSGING
jgi:hypothetical protein